MTRRQEDTGSPATKPESAKPVAPTDTPTASSLWRDKFNASKLAPQNKNQAGAKNGTFGANMPNRFQNKTPGNTSRKAKKGFRAG
jgi:hypothetical protein